jgi:predicted nuclease of predicted toxin-antitoxin system
MRLLADENLHADLVTWLRSQQHDVLYVAEVLQQEDDAKLLDLSQQQGRIVITDDKDFGELVFRRRLTTHGVILLRLTSPDVIVRASRLQEIWDTIEGNQPGNFIVVTEDRVRIRKPRA